VFQNKRDVLGRGVAEAGIEEQAFVIQDESGLK
jgi:hypothetical protein